jgi:hypothetical protein
MLKTMVMY